MFVYHFQTDNTARCFEFYIKRDRALMVKRRQIRMFDCYPKANITRASENLFRRTERRLLEEIIHVARLCVRFDRCVRRETLLRRYGFKSCNRLQN